MKSKTTQISEHNAIIWLRPSLLWLLAALQILIFFSILDSKQKSMLVWIVADPIWLVATWVLLPARMRWIASVFWGLWTIVLCIGSLYYANFLDAPTLEVLINPQGLNSFALRGAITTFSWREIAIIACPVGYWAASYFLRHKAPQPVFPKKLKILTLATCAFTIAAAEGVCMLAYFRSMHGKLFPSSLTELSSFYTQPRFKQMVYMFSVGPAESYIVQACTLCTPKPDLTEAERQEISRYISSRSAPSSFHEGNRGKNLIFIVVESLNTQALGKQAEGVEVTPTLNALSADTCNITATGMRSQVGVGRSADGQFIYNTGLMPLTQTILNSPDPQVSLPSLRKALGEEYYAAEFIGESSTLWNHAVTSRLYGYDALNSSLESGESPDQADAAIFKRALQGISSLPKPFMAFVTTLQMHDDYARPPEEWVLPSSISSDMRDRVYFERAHAFDAALGQFLAGLKEAGLYDNSVIVIAGDHEARPRTLSKAFERDQRVLLIIIGAGHGLYTDLPIAQVDVYPTLLDVMGLSDKYQWPGVGRSLMRRTINPGDTLDDTSATRLSRLIIDGDYFGTSSPQ